MAVDGHLDVVLVGPAEAQPRRDLGGIVALLMRRQLSGNDGGLRQRIRDGPDGLVGQRQRLPAAAALVMGLRGVLLQLPAEAGPVADQHRAHHRQPLVELRQGVQQAGKLLAVPQDAGLVLVQAVVLRQRLGVPGPQLAQGQIHKPPAGRGAVPDQEQILRREEHRVQHVGQRGGVFRRHAVDGHLPLFAPVQLHAGHKLPVTGEDAALQQGALGVEADQLPVGVGAGRLAAGEIDHRLQQVGLSLGVLPVDHVAVGIEGQTLAAVVAEARQRQLIDPHTVRSAPRRPGARCRRGAAFSPAGCIPHR